MKRGAGKDPTKIIILITRGLEVAIITRRKREKRLQKLKILGHAAVATQSTGVGQEKVNKLELLRRH